MTVLRRSCTGAEARESLVETERQKLVAFRSWCR